RRANTVQVGHWTPADFSLSSRRTSRPPKCTSFPSQPLTQRDVGSRERTSLYPKRLPVRGRRRTDTRMDEAGKSTEYRERARRVLSGGVNSNIRLLEKPYP